MKITIDRKSLVNNLKLLRELSKETPRAEQERFKDTVLLKAVPNGLSLAAGFGQAVMCITLPADSQDEGEFLTSYSLYDLVKAARDEEISLTKNERLTISGKSKFRAYLNEKTGAGFPVQIIRDMVDKGISTTTTFRKEEMLGLISIAQVYAPSTGWNYVEIAVTEEGANGTVQGSEIGYIEAYPMQVEGDIDLLFRLQPDYLKPLLSFCGEYVKIQALKVNVGFLLITDPENPSWWATLVQVGKSSQEKYDPK